jgi:hypothetical protein
MDANAEKRMFSMLDVLANGLAELRLEFIGFRSEVRTEIAEFRAETSANFNRIERRLDNHEARITNLERRPLSS